MTSSSLDTRGLVISDVAESLGVPMPTLRSWELRYGIPASGTARVAGSLRRYSAADVEALTLMRDEIARGLRASQAAESVRTLLPRTGPGERYVHPLLTAATRLDATAVRDQLEDAATTLGLTVCLDDVLFPALRQVGLFWQTGRCSVSQEHVLSNTVCTWLHDLARRAPEPIRDGPVLLVPPPKDPHTIGLLALHVLLRRDAICSRVLPTDLSPITLPTAIHHHQPRAVVFVCHLASGRPRSVQRMRKAQECSAPSEYPTRLFYAGNAFSSSRSRRAVPGHYLGTRLGQAVEVISSL
jgi:DNA-binding transcriptional MerR regulator